ncbi:unnamed protein product, partial [Didymodactylos carnosus]
IMDENSFSNNNIFQWQIFVYKCLNNHPPLPLIHNKGAIIGPISANLKDIILGYKPIKRKERPIPTQTAIISMKLAYVLLDGLKGVIIWEIIWLWCFNITSKTISWTVGCPEATTVDLSNFLREVCTEKLNVAEQMGIGEVVQIDESLFRGKQKCRAMPHGFGMSMWY